MLVKRPADAVKTLTNVRRHFRGPHRAAYLSTLREGYKLLWRGIPILSEAHRLFPGDGTFRHELLSSSGLDYCISNLEDAKGRTFEVTDDARVSFENAFGLPPEVQTRVEELFRDMEQHNEILLSELPSDVCYYGQGKPGIP